MSSNLAIVKKDVVDVVANKVREFQEHGELCFPANYSPENAMKAAWLKIQETCDKNGKSAIEVCTQNSIANSLLNMVVQGLNPAKNQCYFIVYGDKLVLQRSYFGSMHVAKTVNPEIDDIVADVIYEGDVFEYAKERGRTVIVKHQQKLENVNKGKIIAAYCSVFYKNGKEDTTIMTIDEIKQAWKMSKLNPVDEKGNLAPGSTHAKFTAEMAKKTVINKACKTIINASDDSTLLIKAYKATEADIAEAEAQEEIKSNANTIYVDADTGEVAELTQPTKQKAEDIEDDLP